jgi:Uma2 family endonuclease
MSSTLLNPAPPSGLPPTELNNGDRLTQAEFHELYRKTRDDFKAELIGGIVYVASPVKARHADNQLPLGTVLILYESATMGVRASDNASLILGPLSEPQPDLHLRILSEYGGQCQLRDDGFIEGAPEWVCEISDSTRSADLYGKMRDYAEAGVCEYLVFNLRENRVHWFELKNDQELSVESEGVIRSLTFPGLWIDVSALLARDLNRLIATAQQGLSSPEHAAFVQQLAAARKS